ncbi:MAG: threonine--tRNA ligase [Polyangiaceae bacterium]|nr:threonine--tRNA ligase [Polyangiaceae bacterium]
MSHEDHRQLGNRLDLFHFQEEAPGMVFWHKNGLVLHRILEARARQVFELQGYEEVRTPLLLRQPIWEASGHWEHFAGGMFKVSDEAVMAALKPVNCPGHVQLIQHRSVSYRDLPIRLAEFGNVHRDEPGGCLHGLLRLRQFTQDDGHIFCTLAQAPAEITAFCRNVAPFYADFGFSEIHIALSTRPAARVGDDALWDRAEAILTEVLQSMALPFEVAEGAGAFYGPKIEFSLKDNQGRSWQCGTVQFDFFMPERFGLAYTAQNGARAPLVMLHRALYGSLERFLGVLLEQHGAALPPWLAPLQILVLPIASAQVEPAHAFAQSLREVGLRCTVDERKQSLSDRVASAHERAVPLLAILGPKEVREGHIAVRRGGTQHSLPLGDALAEFSRLCQAPKLG